MSGRYLTPGARLERLDETQMYFPVAGEEMAELGPGARGWVVRGLSGGYPAHRCPDHGMGNDYDDCRCGGRVGAIVRASEPSALVAWERSDGELENRLVRMSGLGVRWRFVGDEEWVDDVRKSHQLGPVR